MKLFTPLGLLGLLGIAVLILIYVIKPNYQQKTVSSTFVWKLSLKYKKKRVQINKLRNVLLILCQVLVLTACALILAEPNRVVKAETDPSEVIAIIDSSASMRAQKDGESRFERAVKKSLSLSEEVFSNGGLFSVILADENPSFLLNRISAAEEDKVSAALEELLEEDACTYGASNMDAAIKLSENILNENPKAQIYLYTDTTYSYVPSTVNLVSVSETGEWNVGILNARAEMEDNYYAFYVDLACYGQDIDVKLTVSVSGPNTSSSTENVKPTEFETIVKCSKDKTKTVIFKNENEVGKDTENTVYVPIPDQKRIYSYQSVHIYVSDSETATSSLNDSFSEDNTFEIYGGQKEVLKIQYASSLPNPFFSGILLVLQDNFSDRWDIQITEIHEGQQPALKGYDLYIFEHTMPAEMPTDGIVFLADPDKAPVGSGLSLGRIYDCQGSIPLVQENYHDLIKYIDASSLTLSYFTTLSGYDASYDTLLTCNGEPVLLLKDEKEAKVIVSLFSVHHSNTPIKYAFPTLMYNLFEYFLPVTVKGNAFEVNESVSLNARGENLVVSGYDGQEQLEFDTFPATLKVSIPGTYILTQVTDFGKKLSEKIYVRVPRAESNIWNSADSLSEPNRKETDEDSYKNLIVYFAGALVALLFIEWLLQSRESM